MNIPSSYVISISNYALNRKVKAMNDYKPEGMLLKTPKNYEYISTKSGLERALEKQAIIEAPVLLCDHNLNLHVEFTGGMRGIRHYNEGWADGYHWNIEHWEIWNEPDLDRDPKDAFNKRCWSGTVEQFAELYTVAARHLKACNKFLT